MSRVRAGAARWLRRLAVWVDVPVEDALVTRARGLVTQAEQQAAPGTSGEFKRHQVYARLLKNFPSRAKADCASAIEQVIQERSR